MTSLVVRIKKRETPLFDLLYRVAKGILTFNFPCIKIIHLPLYHIRAFVLNTFNTAYQCIWTVPLFKSRCVECGPRLKLPNGMPLVLGHLKLFIGSDVSILDSTLAGGHVHSEPSIRIGDRTHIGYHTDIIASLSVIIGDDVMIAKDCYIADSDGHPVSPSRRLRHEGVNITEINPVVIGNNVWIGTGCYILKGVTIGDNSIIGANTVVTKSIPSNCIAFGSPLVIKPITVE